MFINSLIICLLVLMSTFTIVLDNLAGNYEPPFNNNSNRPELFTPIINGPEGFRVDILRIQIGRFVQCFPNYSY